MYSDSACSDAIHQSDINVDFINEDGIGFAYSYLSETYYDYFTLTDATYGTIQCVTNGGQYDFTEFKDGLQYAVTE